MPLPPNRGSLTQLGVVALPIYRPTGVKTGHAAHALNSYGLKLAVSCLPWLMMLVFCKTKDDNRWYQVQSVQGSNKWGGQEQWGGGGENKEGKGGEN